MRWVPLVDVAFERSKTQQGYTMADYATLLRDHGWRVDVLSRGYGRQSTKIEQVVGRLS